MNFGQRLVILRKELGLTQAQLGVALNKNRSTIGGYEAENKEPDFDTLALIADFFHVSADYLLGRTEIRSIKEEVPVHSNLSSYQQDLLNVSTALNEHNQIALLERAKTLLDLQKEEQLETYQKSI